MKAVIAVAAYNRPEALSRLLQSLARADIPAGVPLIISIDPGGERQAQVEAVARSFEWMQGVKEVRVQPQRLGSMEHLHTLGDLALEQGAVIRLEDDYTVSRAFYHFANAALDAYAADERIAGVSLYGLWFHGYTRLPFVPMLDSADLYFMQTPWSFGQAYTADQWQRFRAWERDQRAGIRAEDPIHESYIRFAPDDWFALSTKYLALTGRYYAFPRMSFVTNWGDAGTHFVRETRFFQVPLQQVIRPWQFGGLDESSAVYDSFMEMTPTCLNRLTDDLQAYDFELDLYACKSTAKVRAPYVISSLPSRAPLMRWGLTRWPLEANIIEGVPGEGLTLSRAEDLRRGPLDQMLARQTLVDAFHRGQGPGLRQWLSQGLARFLRRLPTHLRS